VLGAAPVSAAGFCGAGAPGAQEMTTIEAVINPMIPVQTLVGLMPILLVVDVVTTGPRLRTVDELL
jgi:hypothetical protein